jgi:hypothetical protein
MQYKKYKNASLFGFLFILFSIFSSPIHAETVINQPANVYIDKINIDSNLTAGATTTGTFEIRNASNFSIPDVQYSISLVGDYVGMIPNTSYDTQFFGPVFLEAGEKKTINFTYVVPKIAPDKGSGIQIKALLKSGTPMGWMDAFVVVREGIAGVVVEEASLNVNGATFIPEGGPTVGNGKKGVLMVTLRNPSKDEMVLTPQTEIFDRSETQEKLFSGNEPAVTIAPGTSKTISIPLNTFNDTPKVYAGRVVFLDKDGIARSPVVSYRYIVAGPIVTILKVKADKQEAVKGEKVNLTVDLVGPPIDIVTSVVPKVGMVSAKATLFGKEGAEIGEGTIDVDIDTLASPFIEIPITAQASSDSFAVKIDIIKDGSIITSYSTLLTPAPEKQKTWFQNLVNLKSLYLLIAFLVFIILALYVWKKNQRTDLLLFLIMIAGISVMFFDYDEKKALADFNNNTWTITSTTGTGTSGNTPEYFLNVTGVQIVPSPFNDNDYFVTGSATMQGCGNHLPTYDFEFNGGPKIHRDGTSGGFTIGPYQRSEIVNPSTLKVSATCGGGFGCSGTVEGEISFDYEPPICPWPGESSTCVNYHPSGLSCNVDKQVALVGEQVTFTASYDDAGLANNIRYFWYDYTQAVTGNAFDYIYFLNPQPKTFTHTFSTPGHKYMTLSSGYTLNNYFSFLTTGQNLFNTCHVFIADINDDLDITATPLPCSDGVRLDFSPYYFGKTIYIHRVEGHVDPYTYLFPGMSNHIGTIAVSASNSSYIDTTATPYVAYDWNSFGGTYFTYPGKYTYLFYDYDVSLDTPIGPMPTVTPDATCPGVFASSCWEGAQGHPGSSDYYIGWNQTATWNSSVNGGVPPYTYSWTDNDMGAHPDDKSAVLRKYSTPGTKNMTLTVVDSLGQSAVSSCYVIARGPTNGQCSTTQNNQCISGTLNNNSPADSTSVSRWSCLSTNGGTDDTNCSFTCPDGKIVVNNQCVTPFSSSCSATLPNVEIDETVDWYVTVSGGTPPYNYNWTIDNSSNTSENAYNSYATAGLKTMNVSITDSAGGGSSSQCTVEVGDVTFIPGECGTTHENECLYGVTPIDSPADVGTQSRWTCPSPNGGAISPTCTFNCSVDEILSSEGICIPPPGDSCEPIITPNYDSKIVNEPGNSCSMDWTITFADEVVCGAATTVCEIDGAPTTPFSDVPISIGTHSLVCTTSMGDDSWTTSLLPRPQCRLNPNYGEF